MYTIWIFLIIVERKFKNNNLNSKMTKGKNATEAWQLVATSTTKPNITNISLTHASYATFVIIFYKLKHDVV
jgi:hypothetical protein